MPDVFLPLMATLPVLHRCCVPWNNLIKDCNYAFGSQSAGQSVCVNMWALFFFTWQMRLRGEGLAVMILASTRLADALFVIVFDYTVERVWEASRRSQQEAAERVQATCSVAAS